MKTPREILLEQHQAAAPKLDDIRRETVTKLNHAPNWISSFVSSCLGGLSQLWRELIFPSRRIWAGLAAVWILLFAVNFFLRDSSPAGARRISAPGTMMTFQQQERLLAELDHFSEWRVVEPPKKFVPRPRSECVEMMTA